MSSLTDKDAVDLARRATEPDHAGEGLAAVATLRRRLASLEESYVDEAVQEGWSWGQIARCLGVTRQAAHRKHAKRARQKLDSELRARGLTVTADVTRAVDLATAEARAMGHRQVGAGHLLLGIAVAGGNPCGLLDQAGVSLARIREAVGRLHGATVFAAEGALDAGPPLNGDEARLPLSPSAHRALQRSVRQARALSSRTLLPDHVLLSLMRDPKSPARALVLGLGADPDDICAEVVAQIGNGSIELAAGGEHREAQPDPPR